MATNNSVNLGVQENADGGQIQLGIVQRILKWLGADITITGAGSATVTFPSVDASLLSDAAGEFTALDEKTTLHADDLFVIEDAEDGGIKKKVKSSNVGGSSGGLSVIVASVTTSNVTVAEDTHYVLDVSGMTANRDFSLPTPSAAGKRVKVTLSVGDATYALLLKRNSTELTRIFITNESMELVSVGTGAADWVISVDGRIPCMAVLQRQAAQSINNITVTKIAFDTAVINRGDMGDITTNDRVDIRRDGFYESAGFLSISNVLDDQEFLEAELYVDNVIKKFKRDYVSFATGNVFASPEVTDRRPLTAGQYIDFRAYHTEGAAQNTDTTYYPTLMVKEIL